MTPTENLKKHMDEIEQRRLTLYFHMQKVASDLNSRLYHIQIVISVIAIAVIFANMVFDHRDQFFIMWSNVFAFISFVVALLHYLHIMEKISGKIYAHTCAIYKGYDDEYYILKKYNIGELDEELIRQFYVNKTQEAERYICSVIAPGWVTWISLSSLFGAITLLLLA
jgi:hypothetical protein